MITLVLEDDGGEAGDVFSCVANWQLAAWRQGVADCNLLISRHFSPSARHAQAAFRAGYGLPVSRDDADIGVNLKRLALLVEALDGDDAARDAYLGACNAHTVLLRRGDGGKHLVS